MKMDEILFVCDQCGEGFTLEESDTRYLDGEPHTVCPNCGSFDMEEAGRCRVCRDIHRTYKLRHGVCESCFADAVAAYKACIEYLQPWEREVLEDEYGNLDVTENI